MVKKKEEGWEMGGEEQGMKMLPNRSRDRQEPMGGRRGLIWVLVVVVLGGGELCCESVR